MILRILRRGCALLLCSALWLGFHISCAGAAELNKESEVGFYLDTVITLQSYGADKSILSEAMALCGEYEALLSKTVEGSDVWRMNHAQGAPTQVSGITLEILKAALRVSELSGGVFDVSVAPAVALWDFTSGEAVLPDPAALEAAAALVNYKDIAISGDTVTMPPGMMVDLGSIAKGYIADALANYLREKGVQHALVDCGGNVVTVGTKPDGSDIRVGLQNPKAPRNQILGMIPASDTSVVTSGIYERGFDLDGVRYHHILDPGTGWPVQNSLAAVTIIADSSMLADALSTASFALGEEKAREMLAGLDGVEAVFIDRENRITCTDGIRDRLIIY